MRDPIRMVESGELSSFEFELLESARREEPDERVKGLLFAGLGGASIVPLTQLSTPPAPFLTAPTWSKVSLLRWVSGVGLGGALAVGWLASRPAPRATEPCAGENCGALLEAPAPPNELPAPSAAYSAASDVARPEKEASDPSGTRAEPLSAPREPDQATPASAEARGSSPTRRSVSASGALRSLTEEVAALEPARVALGAGDSAQALRVLSRYQARFPKGVLRPEADALRAQARSLAGTSASRNQSESEASPAGALKPR